LAVLVEHQVLARFVQQLVVVQARLVILPLARVGQEVAAI
jgi:hypothetical protein